MAIFEGRPGFFDQLVIEGLFETMVLGFGVADGDADGPGVEVTLAYQETAGGDEGAGKPQGIRRFG